MIVYIVVAFAAVLGILIGLGLGRNGVSPYGVGNNYGKHHMEKMEGTEKKDYMPDRWDS